MRRILHIVAALTMSAVTLFISGCGSGKKENDSSERQPQAEQYQESKEARATLLFVGDAMTHQAQLEQALKLGGGKYYDFSDCFTLIEEQVKQADYAIVNLETPLGGGRGGYTGFPCFSAPDSYAVALKKAGFDLFLTANNHTLDRGDYGLRRTIHALDSLEVPHTGTFLNYSDRLTKVPFITDINGIKVAFLNYTYGTNGIEARDGAEVSLIDRDKMKREIDDARKSGAEMIAVCVHWGVEYQLHEHSSQRSLADFLLEEEVDMIIGSHPHVVQPMKMMESPSGKRVPVIYSLGNFISNMKTDDTRGGAMVYVEISRNEKGECTVGEVTYDTFYAAKPDPNAKPGSAFRNFTVVPSEMASDSIPSSQKGWWTVFNRRAENLFATSNKSVPHR